MIFFRDWALSWPEIQPFKALSLDGVSTRTFFALRSLYEAGFTTIDAVSILSDAEIRATLKGVENVGKKAAAEVIEVVSAYREHRPTDADRFLNLGKRNAERDAEIRQAVQDGERAVEVARRYGIGRQRVWDIARASGPCSVPERYV